MRPHCFYRVGQRARPDPVSHGFIALMRTMFCTKIPWYLTTRVLLLTRQQTASYSRSKHVDTQSMQYLAPEKKKPKRRSEFQKLWERAEKLQHENARFFRQVDHIVARIQNEVCPVEIEAARKHGPLLNRLLSLGQRKSLTQWQRGVLDEWIHELLEPLQHAGDLDADIMDNLARYEAFAAGITLDENSPASLMEQVSERLAERHEAAQDEAFGKNPWQALIDDEIEHLLDETLGPAPAQPKDTPSGTGDLFQEELQREVEKQQRRYEAYQARRDEMREELRRNMRGDGGFCPEFEMPGFEEMLSGDEPGQGPVIDNAVFTRLFRSTARQLHPDRETDPARREEKHALMTRLLQARKQGDVMTIVTMYEEYIGADAALSKADRKQLIEALRRQIAALDNAREDYRDESPLHRMAIDVFYRPGRKQTDRAITEYIETMRQAGEEAEILSREITTLKSLKPYLEQRYEEQRFFNPFF